MKRFYNVIECPQAHTESFVVYIGDDDYLNVGGFQAGQDPVNSGSLEKDILKKYNGVTPAGMVESGLRHVELLKSLDFHQIKISLKASDVWRTLEAYRLLSAKTDLPLHVGVTEAGALYSGIVKSALGIGMLLAEGIGDTIRVSLPRDPVEEVRVGFEILKALDIRRRGPEIISCPTCGRCNIALFDIVERVEKALMTTAETLKIAIMGCVVNGPGEARDADIGIAGGKGHGVLFKKGRVVRKIKEKSLPGSYIVYNSLTGTKKKVLVEG